MSSLEHAGRGRAPATCRMPVRVNDTDEMSGRFVKRLVHVFVGTRAAREKVSFMLDRGAMELKPVMVFGGDVTPEAKRVDVPYWYPAKDDFVGGEAESDYWGNGARGPSVAELSEASIVVGELWGPEDSVEIFCQQKFCDRSTVVLDVRVPYAASGSGKDKVRNNPNPGRMARVARGKHEQEVKDRTTRMLQVAKGL